MSYAYVLLNVFADTKFQGTQVPVVLLESPLAEEMKISIASEFSNMETLFFDLSTPNQAFSTYSNSSRPPFSAHTILAASYMVRDMGGGVDCKNYVSVTLDINGNTIESFVDKENKRSSKVLFKRELNPSIDRYAPHGRDIAEALGLDIKHIFYEKYTPLAVYVDHSVLVVPLTKPEYVHAAKLDVSKWADLLSSIHSTDLMLFSPGTITGRSDFHGRIINPNTALGECPAIGRVLPEFVAYLAQQETVAEGTHSFTIDRGSDSTRNSILSVEFDKGKNEKTICRIGGGVIKGGRGVLYA